MTQPPSYQAACSSGRTTNIADLADACRLHRNLCRRVCRLNLLITLDCVDVWGA
jgi:hypothetical protein